MADAIEIEYRGEFFPSFSAFARRLGICRTTLNRYRLMGYPLEDCVRLCTEKRIKFSHNGKGYSSYSELASESGLKPALLTSRLRRHKALDEALITKVKSTSIKIKYNGLEYSSLAEFAKAFNFKPSVVYHRLQLGWTLDATVSTPVDTTRGVSTSVEIDNCKYSSLAELCLAYSIPYATFLVRVKKGMSVEKAVKTPVRTKEHKVRDLTYNNIQFTSLSEIGRTFNINPVTLRTRLDSGWSLKDAIEKPVRN